MEKDFIVDLWLRINLWLHIEIQNLVRFIKTRFLGSNWGSFNSKSKTFKWSDRGINSSRLAQVFFPFPCTRLHSIEVPLMHNSSNLVNLDSTPGEIRLRRVQCVISNTFRCWRRPISLGNSSILEPNNLRTSRFTNAPIDDISFKTQNLRCNVRMFCRTCKLQWWWQRSNPHVLQS